MCICSRNAIGKTEKSMNNKKSGKVSIVVPVYNGKQNIEQTLKRILQSSYEELEVVVVDDGSSDESLQICEKISSRDKRVIVYTKENGGVVSARNYGVVKATGEYLCFCDQDDFVEQETYERMVACMERDACDICMCSTGRSIKGKKSDFEKSDDACYKDMEMLEQVLYPIIFNGYDIPVSKGRLRRYPHIWNCMFRKSFWEEHQFKFRRYVNYEDDYLMKIDTLSRAKCVSTISYVGYYWNVNLESETYKHKYVEDLASKQQLCYDDMKECLKRCIDNKQHLKYFKQVTKCKQYLEAVHILTSPYKKKSHKFIKNFFEEAIYQNEFEECIVAEKFLEKGQVKAGLILPILKRRMTLSCYLAEIILDGILWMTLHSQLLTQIERMLKWRKHG